PCAAESSVRNNCTRRSARICSPASSWVSSTGFCSSCRRPPSSAPPANSPVRAPSTSASSHWRRWATATSFRVATSLEAWLSSRASAGRWSLPRRVDGWGAPTGGIRTRTVPIESTALLPALAEVDGPLLHEGVAPLHRLVGAVVEVERGEGELGHARALLRVHVERLLGQGQRRRALLEELAAPRV